MYERVLGKLALITGQRIGAGGVEHATFRELVNGLDEQEKPCFVIMKCTDKNAQTRHDQLQSVRAIKASSRYNYSRHTWRLYAVRASKAMVDKLREQAEGGSW